MKNFYDSLKVGKTGEEELDFFFANFYNIYKVTLEEELKFGIDRIYENEKGVKTKIEYKTEMVGHKTGNAFIEIISNDKTFSEGWAIKTHADKIFYYVYHTKELYIIDNFKLKSIIHDIIYRYPKAVCKNENYNSHGRLIPFKDLKEISKFMLLK